MQTENEATTLLETLQRLTGCTFLSDLHTEQYRAALLSALDTVQTAAYSAKTWNYAASYISMEPCAFSTADEARAWLTERLTSS